MNPFELLEHIESELGIATYAMNWPIGSGKEFKGVYERDHHRIIAFHGGDHGQKAAEVSEGTLEDETFRGVLGDHSSSSCVRIVSCWISPALNLIRSLFQRES